MFSDFRLLLPVMSAPWRGTFWTPRIVLPKTAEAARRRSKLIAAPDFAIVLASMDTLRGGRARRWMGVPMSPHSRPQQSFSPKHGSGLHLPGRRDLAAVACLGSMPSHGWPANHRTDSWPAPSTHGVPEKASPKKLLMREVFQFSARAALGSAEARRRNNLIFGRRCKHWMLRRTQAAMLAGCVNERVSVGRWCFAWKRSAAV
jgi:hypothetical protein